ncbi:MAG: hypothetical protein LAO24_00965 [Acidobacteriia bacterium]|nr:hypothetical protein [Terriglobia bacterium]
MQFAKDSFFLALQQRLAGLNPARVVTIGGTTVPAVLVVENLPPSSAERQANTFYLEWGLANVVEGHAGNGVLMSMECVISYYTLGSVDSMVDRGRVQGELDSELLAICQPANTEKRDYTRAPSVDLGTGVFWNQPGFDGAKKSSVADDAARQTDSRAERRARVTMFFFTEVKAS